MGLDTLMEEQTSPDVMFQIGHISSLDKTVEKEGEIDKYYSKFYRPEPILYKIEKFINKSVYYLSLGIWDARRA
jgi:hypothetical protein